MATLGRLDGESSRCHTPDPPVLRDSSWAREDGNSWSGARTLSRVAKANEDEWQHDGSGAETPERVAKANEDLKITLQMLGAEVVEKLRDFNTAPPPGLCMPAAKNCRGKNVVEEVMSMNLTQPWGAAPSSMSRLLPHLHSEPMFIGWDHNDQGAVSKAKSVKPPMKEQLVSEGDVGLSLSCCPSVRRGKMEINGGRSPAACQRATQTSKNKSGSQQELFAGAGAGSEDARLKEARSLATKLVTLLGGADPFANKAENGKVVAPKFPAGAMQHLRSCRSLGQEARSSSGGAIYSAAAWDLQGQGVGDSTRGAGYSAVAQDMQGSHANRPPVSSFDALTTVSPVLSNLAWDRNQEELPGPGASPQQTTLVVSQGSLGHPHSCGPPCKFATSAKGCKDGQVCSHCHLCRWSRYRARLQQAAK